MQSSKFFLCQNCNKKVNLLAPGTKHRNHCPYCLHSLHLDQKPGDRKSICGGLMQPIGKTFKKDGEEMVVHKCITCGVTSKNRVAGDDSPKGVRALTVVDF